MHRWSTGSPYDPAPCTETDALMPEVLGDCEEAGLTRARTKDAVMSIGYRRHAFQRLDRWDSKRTTGGFGR